MSARARALSVRNFCELCVPVVSPTAELITSVVLRGSSPTVREGSSLHRHQPQDPIVIARRLSTTIAIRS